MGGLLYALYSMQCSLPKVVTQGSGVNVDTLFNNLEITILSIGK